MLRTGTEVFKTLNMLTLTDLITIQMHWPLFRYPQLDNFLFTVICLMQGIEAVIKGSGRRLIPVSVA